MSRIELGYLTWQIDGVQHSATSFIDAEERDFFNENGELNSDWLWIVSDICREVSDRVQELQVAGAVQIRWEPAKPPFGTTCEGVTANSDT